MIKHYANCNLYSLCGLCVDCHSLEYTTIIEKVNCNTCKDQLESMKTNHGRGYKIVLEYDNWGKPLPLGIEVYANTEESMKAFKGVLSNAKFYQYNPGHMDYEEV